MTNEPEQGYTLQWAHIKQIPGLGGLGSLYYICSCLLIERCSSERANAACSLYAALALERFDCRLSQRAKYSGNRAIVEALCRKEVLERGDISTTRSPRQQASRTLCVTRMIVLRRVCQIR